MTRCFAYIRVSTPRQGETGVSLQEQRFAIEQYAKRHSLTVLQWFEERETAAKSGRRAFTRMLKLLKRGRAHGVIFHKIDRSARNARDWADVSDLIDAGTSVHFTNESLDLSTTGGRLSADIQATVAAHYIRNLREETKKGIYGRLRQGLLPLPAPLGYLDKGRGKPKSIDPIRGPLLKLAFELYASKRYSLRNLGEELYRRGLRNRAGRRVSINSLSIALNNPFYAGRIRLKRTGELFEGVHESVVSEHLFQETQRRLRAKTQVKVRTHDFEFRLLFACAKCGRHLAGEIQKGHVYYRCHSRSCPVTCVREERLSEVVLSALHSIHYPSHSEAEIHQAFRIALQEALGGIADARRTLELQLDQCAAHLARLTDAFLDGTIERELFKERKELLFSRRVQLQEDLANGRTSAFDVHVTAEKMFELASKAWLSYRSADQPLRRQILEVMSSNRVVSPEGAFVELSSPFSSFQSVTPVLSGSAQRDSLRTGARRLKALAREVVEWITRHPYEAGLLRILAQELSFNGDVPQDTGLADGRETA